MPGGTLPPRAARSMRRGACGWLTGSFFAISIAGAGLLASSPADAATVRSGLLLGGSTAFLINQVVPPANRHDDATQVADTGKAAAREAPPAAAEASAARGDIPPAATTGAGATLPATYFRAAASTMTFTSPSGASWQITDARSRLPGVPTAGILGSGPCHWKNDSFGTSQTFSRCGYPARLAAAGNQDSLHWWFGRPSGGGGGGDSAGRTSPAPVPLPAAGWLLLGALALPRLLRRR